MHILCSAADLTDEVCLSPTLGNPNPNACESHEQCTNKVTVTGPCGVPQCVNGACVEGFAPASQVCRDANLKDSPCDAPEVRSRYCAGAFVAHPVPGPVAAAVHAGAETGRHMVTACMPQCACFHS